MCSGAEMFRLHKEFGDVSRFGIFQRVLKHISALSVSAYRFFLQFLRDRKQKGGGIGAFGFVGSVWDTLEVVNLLLLTENCCPYGTWRRCERSMDGRKHKKGGSYEETKRKQNDRKITEERRIYAGGAVDRGSNHSGTGSDCNTGV